MREIKNHAAWLLLLTGIWAYALPSPLYYAAGLFGTFFFVLLFCEEPIWSTTVATITSLVAAMFFGFDWLAKFFGFEL